MEWNRESSFMRMRKVSWLMLKVLKVWLLTTRILENTNFCASFNAINQLNIVVC